MRRALGESFGNTLRSPITSAAPWLVAGEPDGLRNGGELMPDRMKPFGQSWSRAAWKPDARESRKPFRGIFAPARESP